MSYLIVDLRPDKYTWKHAVKHILRSVSW